MLETMEKLIEKSKANIKANEGDYLGDDGLLYCGNCNTKKQTKIKICGMVKYPMCLCRCEAEKKEAEEKRRKRFEFERRVQELRRVGFHEKEMRKWTFENDDMSNERITAAMKNYVNNFTHFRKQGKGLLLYGSVGTGKTYAACSVANALIDKGIPVMVTKLARIINTLQGTLDKQEYIDSFNKFSLLVIDDLGAERDTAFAKEQVYNIIDSRYRSKLPMIITTNLSAEEIKNPGDIVGRRIYDRIMQHCFPIEISGYSRRRKAVKESYTDMKNILGL